MAAGTRLVDPNDLDRNPENPRLIFRQDELDSLQASIQEQGVLVPLTVYEKRGKGNRFVILDGERRWRCAIKLALPKVPVIIQEEPDKMTNLMMMFAIHNQRKEWDPLPTAYKLQELEREFASKHGREPKEAELASLASLTRGEVRRLKALLGLPREFHRMLLDELDKPRSQQRLRADHVLEVTKGALALRKRGVIDAKEENNLRRELVVKFREGIIENTTDPRQLARIARAVDRGAIEKRTARKVTLKLATDREYTIRQAYESSVESVEREHAIDQLARRVITKLEDHVDHGLDLGPEARRTLTELAALIRRLLSK
jgi:ParB family transcriptional regulator, chromosome partitioning protein